jgi:N-acetylmuramoyl-L-alanine amidase
MPFNHTVEKGDCMTSIAAQYGFGKYETIYNDAANSQFKTDNPNPNQLKPGGVVVIPDRKEKKFSKSTDASHKFKVKIPKAKLKLELKDEQGNALANKKYQLTIGNNVIEETTDGSGKIEKDIPPESTIGTLTLWMDQSDPAAQVFHFGIDLGALEPESTIKGAQARLQNLGYDCGGITGVLDPKTQDAIRAFQQANGLTVNGNLDDPTKNKLKNVYKS